MTSPILYCPSVIWFKLLFSSTETKLLTFFFTDWSPRTQYQISERNSATSNKYISTNVKKHFLKRQNFTKNAVRYTAINPIQSTQCSFLLAVPLTTYFSINGCINRHSSPQWSKVYVPSNGLAI